MATRQSGGQGRARHANVGRHSGTLQGAACTPGTGATGRQRPASAGTPATDDAAQATRVRASPKHHTNPLLHVHDEVVTRENYAAMHAGADCRGRIQARRAGTNDAGLGELVPVAVANNWMSNHPRIAVKGGVRGHNHRVEEQEEAQCKPMFKATGNDHRDSVAAAGWLRTSEENTLASFVPTATPTKMSPKRDAGYNPTRKLPVYR